MERFRISCMRRIGSFLQQRARFMASSKCKPPRSLTTAKSGGWQRRGTCWAASGALLAASLLAANVDEPHGDDADAAQPLSMQAAREDDVDAAEAAVEKDELPREEKARQRYLKLGQYLRERIVGQEGAIDAVVSAVRCKLSGWADDDHPLVLLFLGSSGIGKTELAKLIADYLHPDNKKAFIRIDMSEYQQKHEVAKFIGSPPGYRGHDAGGQLTSKLNDVKDAVVLFDEVEKAHPDILTVLLQLFDEGRMTDGKGVTIDCPKAIFIMTSNLATEQIADHVVQLRQEAAQVPCPFVESPIAGVQTCQKKTLTIADLTEAVTISSKFKEEIVRPILKKHFGRDEFLGRINEMVYFLPFSQADLADLVRRQLNALRQRVAKKFNMSIDWTNDVIEQLAAGYNVRYGARSIKQEVERRVTMRLAAAHGRGDIKAGASVQIVVEGGDFAIKVADAGAHDTLHRTISWLLGT